MTKSLPLYLLLAILMTRMAGAQELPEYCRESLREFEQHLSGQVVWEFPLTSGSQYYLEEWLEGEVLLVSGMYSPTSLLRYNSYLDEFFWFHEDSGHQVKLDRGLIQEVKLNRLPGSEPLKFRKLWISQPPVGNRREVYAQVLVDDSISLYCHRNIVQTRMEYKKVGGSVFERPHLSSDYKYYIVIRGARTTSFSTIRRKIIYSLFPERRAEIKKFIRSHSIRLKQEDDLVRLFRFLNT